MIIVDDESNSVIIRLLQINIEAAAFIALCTAENDEYKEGED